MKSNTKGKLMLICLVALISLSFVFGSNIANYPAKLSENPVSTSNENLGDPLASTNGDFKIYWKANGTALTNSTDVSVGSDHPIISDGNGGAIIAWQDNRVEGAGGGDIYAQKINSNGVLLWGSNGTIICNATDIQDAPIICTDGLGGAIIAWRDRRTYGLTGSDVYAQHVDSNGITHWGDEKSWGGNPDRNGTVICNATGHQKYIEICSDEAKGAIIAWEDEREDAGDIYAQHVDSDGTKHWGESWWSATNDRNGTVICNATGNQEEYISMCADGSKGAIITWYDGRGNNDIYAQHVDSDGNTHWGESSWSGPNDLNGTIICNATGDQYISRICSDGDGGAFVVWHDWRAGDMDLYAQYVSSDGTKHWGESWWSGPNDRNGTVICNATGDQWMGQAICYDGQGNVFITWEDPRDDPEDDVYAQRLSSDGITHWGDGSSWGGKTDRNGTVICNIPGGLPSGWTAPSIYADGSGSIFIAWSDGRNGPENVYAQRVSYDGTTHWGNGTTWGEMPDRNGTAICNVEGKKSWINNKIYYPAICSDMSGGFIVAWHDLRVPGGVSAAGLYAQRVGVRSTGGGGLPAGDDDDDDDEDTGIVVVVVVIIIIACVGGVVVVVIVLIQKGIIDTSKLKRG